jgi:hypothetical protein
VTKGPTQESIATKLTVPERVLLSRFRLRFIQWKLQAGFRLAALLANGFSTRPGGRDDAIQGWA